MQKYFKKITERLVAEHWEECKITDLKYDEIFRERMGRKILGTYKYKGLDSNGEVEYSIAKKR